MGATVVVLLLMAGSAVLPTKALLTMSAAFGILMLVFQEGRLQGLLDYTSQGALEAAQPSSCLRSPSGSRPTTASSLLARIKEARDGGTPNDEAVAVRLEADGTGS